MLHFMRFFGDRNEGDDEDRSLWIHEKVYGLWSEIDTIRVLLEEYDETQIMKEKRLGLPVFSKEQLQQQ